MLDETAAQSSMDQFPFGSMDSKPPDLETKNTCLQKLMAIFQGICPEYLEKVAEKWNYCANDIAGDIVEQEHSGFKYPRRKKRKDTERKRSEPRDVMQDMRDIRRKYDDDAREAPAEQKIHRMHQLLREEFPHHSLNVISETMRENRHNFFLTYLALQGTAAPGKQERDGILRILGLPPYAAYKNVPGDADDSIREELHASRRYYALQEYLKLGQRFKEAERRNFEYAKDHGLLRECECCFMDFPLNRMVSCNGEPNHLFCRQCPRKLAEETIGQSRYQLKCLSLRECSAAFSLTERAKFLDKGLITALERIEQDAVLRAANIEGLVQCPFCPFAAICGPKEENREFPCQNPDCLVVSCRLCRSESHVPLSCEEAVQKTGASARHEIEEAMSSALIRKCNKCGTPFIKTLGCNKVSCTRCGNIQCDVCSKNCDYTHFKENQPKTETGAKGCPLYDNAEHRYAQEVDAAEKETRERLVNEHPEIDAQYLEIPRAPASNKRRRAPILRMFEQNAVRVAPRNVPQNAPQNVPQNAPQDDGYRGSQDGSQDGSQEDSEEDSQDGYDYDSEVESLEAAQDDSQDESSDEEEKPNKRQRREPNEEVVARHLDIPRAPRPRLAVPNPVPAQPANDLTQQRPQFVFPFGVINQNGIPPWPPGQQQQISTQQRQANVQQQQQVNVQQQGQANVQQQQQSQQQATAQQLLALQQEQVVMPQWLEHREPTHFQLARAHHHAQLQAQQLQRMQAQEQAQQRQAGTVQQQHRALMQARRQEQLQLLVRAQAQFHQQEQQRALQMAQVMAQQEAQQREQRRAQEQAQQQTLEQIQMQALQQTLQQVQSSPWEALEQALLNSHHETLRHLSHLDAQQLGLTPYQSLNQLGTQQHALPQHQAQGHFPNLQAQQQGPAEQGLGMPPAIAEEGDWGQYQHHGQ